MNRSSLTFTYKDALDTSTVSTTSEVQLPTAAQPAFCVLVSAQAAVGMYLLVAIVFSEWKHRDSPVTSSQMHAKWLRRVCLLSMSLGTTHLLVNVAAIFTPPSQNSCTFRLAVQKISYCFAMFSVYCFLWLRQKRFYSNPSLKYLYTRRLRLCSWAVLGVILTCFTCQSVMTVLAVVKADDGETLSESRMCPNPLKQIWTIQITFSAIAGFVVHTSLMCLFIYPLCKHRVQNASHFVRRQNGSFISRVSLPSPTLGRDDGVSANTSNSLLRNSLRKIYQDATAMEIEVKSPFTPRRLTNPREMRRKQPANAADRMRLLIRRCLLLTTTCVVSSISVTVITAALYRGGLLATFLFGTNVLINMICCAGCFNHWLATLFPFCVKPKKQKFSRRGTSSKRSPSETSQMIGRKFDSII